MIDKLEKMLILKQQIQMFFYFQKFLKIMVLLYAMFLVLVEKNIRLREDHSLIYLK